MAPFVQGTSATFVRGLTALKTAIPDPSAVSAAAADASRDRASQYAREAKGVMSSELEQVLLKVTRPDDVSVKSKHLERLVAMSYSVPRDFDLYFNVLRKLWGKMAEGDWQTKCKALYVLHKFAAEGSPTHAQNLKGTLRKMRRTRDDMRHCKYFNSQRLMHLPCEERAQFRGAGPQTVPKKTTRRLELGGDRLRENR